MLDKVVIHLKNIIFFKLVVYTISIVLLGVLIPEFQDQLVKSLHGKERAEILFNQSIIQLNSIVEFEQKIPEINLQYKELLANSNNKICDTREGLLSNLSLISQKRNLYEPIKAKVVRVFDNPSIQNKNSEIILYQYEVTINFAVDSYEEVLNVSDDIYKTLPVGAVIICMQIRKLQALTPEIIQKLSTKDFPGLTEVSIKVLLREIVYEE
ncbi:hypothetical protein MPCS_00941 [Candidatus Megaera polyxenophila]|nr:hypothetical protein MPCS_00941 [Candidatus Megaera polyxenophila]